MVHEALRIVLIKDVKKKHQTAAFTTHLTPVTGLKVTNNKQKNYCSATNRINSDQIRES